MLVRNPCVRDARVLREASALAEAGHEVVVLATAERGVPSEEERDGFRIRRVEPVPPWIRRVARRAAVPPHAAGAGAASIDPVAAGASRRPPVLVAVRDRLVTGRLTAAALRTPAEAYHAHDLNTLEAAWRAAWRHRARLVYDAHELYPELSGLSPPERRRWARLERRLIGEADRTVTVSESLAEELGRRYGIERPVVLLNCPERPDAQPDPARSPLSALRSGGRLLVLYTGAMSANRGLEALVDAAGRARGWRLAMMGWGRIEADLRRRGPAVAFVPPVPPGEIVAAAAAADVGVVPYLPVGLNNALCLPNKLFDYVHAGLAVAVSDLVELRRFVERHRVGVVFEPGRGESIARVLDGLAAEPERLAAMRTAAAGAAAACDWANEKRKLVDLYAGLLGRR